MRKIFKIAIMASIILISSISGIIIGWFINFNIIRTYGYNFRNAFPNLSFSFPVGLYEPGDESNRLFVLELGGKIYSFNNDVNETQKTLFLDISDYVSIGGERGLLGLAFHPNFSINGFFYLDYTNTTGDTVISRFKVDDTDNSIANKSSEKIILRINQPYSNHNGGQLAFGPDGYLYIAVGDGGSAGDPQGNSQNRGTLHGSILRIDVDNGDPYSIPNDNPFYGNVNGYKEEIFAFGLRNPWRFSFDFNTNLLWAADVGQDAWEEIDIIESGKNYGWNAFEGNHPYNSGTNVTKVEPPIFEYAHGVGHSITGGFVYRGSQLPDLLGKYIYADFEFGQIWALDYDGIHPNKNNILVDTNSAITSFGLDTNNELYFCASNGQIYELIRI
ncbi:MAG: PQQ-dependent sugar dehydrogenase [Candidatus Thorarchaeota archaeon]